MFSADDLLEVLRRRRTLKSIRPEEPGRLPPGWERWLEAMPAGAGAVTGAPPPAFLEVFAQRPLRAPPPPGPALTRWQAFATMWRQQWHPALREERGLRVFAMTTSMLLHVGFAVLLAWLMYVHLLVLLSTPTGESAVVEVEFLGTGTPSDVGGGALEVREEPDQAQRQAAAVPAGATTAPVEARPTDAVQAASPDLVQPELEVDVAAPAVAATVPPLPQREVPTPALPTTSQPLQVTEVARPDIDFVLPPTTTQVDAVRQPELAVPTRDVPAPEVVEVVEADLPSQLPTIAIEVPDATRPVPALPSREIPAPEAPAVARLPARAVPAPRVDVRAPALDAPEIQVAKIPAPAGPPARPANATADATADSGEAAAGERVAGEATATGGTDSPAGAPAARTGLGPATAAAPGGWPAPSRGDDWDDALRNRAGANEGGDAGLFDGTGRPRLAGTGDAGPPGGAPPGSEARAAIDLAKGGTWLRRPPYDYKPTRFDAFWIPTGTLLEEWVRKGIRQVSIPVPGTSMEIVCVVSILQLGGGCGLDDLDVNDEPSSGKAAPDVPFKPELQDNQDALARPPGG
ncbi:MAG TPA: hypothetical protein VFM73_00035 [Xanthomonadaceae bacterium]|nr:hypothetical protein [Xanthomonadaceae bacterium]